MSWVKYIVEVKFALCVLVFYFIDTEIYPRKSWRIKFVLILNVANQEHERQNFTVKNIVRSISNTNDEGSLMMNESTEENIIRIKILALLRNGRENICFCLLSWRICLKTRNKNTAHKTKQNVRLLENFLKQRTKTGKLKVFQPSACTKDGIKDEPASLQSLIAGTLQAQPFLTYICSPPSTQNRDEEALLAG